VFIELDLSDVPARTRLVEADDFKAFAVVADGPRERFAAAAEPLGRVDGDHVFVDLGVLREMAGDHGQDAAWLTGLQQMVDYAAAHGWTDADGRVRAHVEWR
jgi:hypothetical protein